VGQCCTYEDLPEDHKVQKIIDWPTAILSQSSRFLGVCASSELVKDFSRRMKPLVLLMRRTQSLSGHGSESIYGDLKQAIATAPCFS